MLTHLDLFSGIGGFALATEWAGFKTIGFVEIDSYCQKVLRKHWFDVPIVNDIRDVETIKAVVANAKKPEGSMDGRIVSTSESWQFGGGSSERDLGCQRTGEHRSGIGKQSTEPQPVILITGGFPCQPFSVAGKRGGKADDRYLWPEMLRVIEEVRPRWVLGENVAGIVRMELDTCLSDLERIGYTTQAFIIPACAVNAPHRRDRVWIIAHDDRDRCLSRTTLVREGFNTLDKEPKTEAHNERGQELECELREIDNVANPTTGQSWQQTESEGREDSGRRSQEVIIADSPEQRLYSEKDIRKLEGTGGNELDISQSRSYRGDWWAVEPQLGRVAHGIPNRVDRLKCLGNAIVPQVAYQIIKAIAKIEDEAKD